VPIYEYVCDSCGERIEVLQRLSDPPPESCPRDAGTLIRVLSAHNVGGDGVATTSISSEQPGMSCGTCGKLGPGCS